MMGAGVFAAFGPAARSAGSALLLGLAVAAVVAYCNATSSARLAALYPESGGTYVYGRRRLGDFWGYLAGWGFVVGKTSSCAAMALTVGVYLAPGHPWLSRVLAVAAVVALTVLSYHGIQKTAWLTRLVVVLTLLTLALVVSAALLAAPARPGALALFPDGFSAADLHGVLQASGLLFFAFAGYARIATLGEEVRDPQRTIPRAIPLALGITLVIYAVVAVSALLAVGPDGLAAAGAPLRAVVEAGSWAAAAPLVQAGAAVAALGSLLALVLGVSRTTLAMARDRHLPAGLAAVHPRHQVPHRAELAVAAVVVVLVCAVDLREAIGFSSFAVLAYYAVANASAATLGPDEGRPPRVVPVLGLLGCLVLAFTLPMGSVVAGAGVLVVGALVRLVRRRTVATG
ncbi:amino acid permease [Auraticoccus sp. F435]|uniref:Amino acid permease n=2 Tax=Auraticoccus cholistanensis TaxID=2656650 RepID=A0A6A9V2A5_9ACTN|nr:amino acid permease [Auraticoccus cholistanensis]